MSAPADNTSEFVAVRFPFDDTAISFLKSLDVAKWDARAKTWVMPRADWEVLVSDDNNLPQQIRDSAAWPNEWKHVLKATEVLRAATVEPREEMPKYLFVGGRRRFLQVGGAQ